SSGSTPSAPGPAWKGSSPPVTWPTTTTSKPSPPPAPAAWPRSTPNDGWRRRDLNESSRHAECAYCSVVGFAGMTTRDNSDAVGPARARVPALRGHWLLGCGPRFTRDPLGLYLEASRLGDCVRLHLLPGMHCYLLSHPEAIEHVLQRRQKNYRKP